jgi:hypothetical protein
LQLADFFFNTENSENTERHRENMTIGMRVDERDQKVLHRGWLMKDGGTALCVLSVLCVEKKHAKVERHK